jgi:hypothetical protein
MPWNEGALPAIAAVGGAKSKRCGASKALFLDGTLPDCQRGGLLVKLTTNNII